MMSNGAEFTVVETALRATSLEPAGELAAGGRLYAASIKTVGDTRGRHRHPGGRPAPEPLPGYRRVSPMVFCGIYPADGAQIRRSARSPEKLQLTTPPSPLSRRPRWPSVSASAAVLGLLHMEIIEERLGGVQSRPDHHRASGRLPVTKRRLVVLIDNPTNLPDPYIQRAEEPMTNAHIFPDGICGQHHGAMPGPPRAIQGYEISRRRPVDIHYELPLE